ncbi:MAG TPA: YciI family protein [Tepidisphaeraceae bacterium]|nr:YciI family protein [Tepidisphaeraceae bacterium]
MKYALIVYENAVGFAARTNEDRQTYWAAWTAYGKALGQAGVMAGGNALQGPGTATVVRVAGERRQVQDGPFADSKEQLGGFFVIDVPSLDDALAWAERAPCTSMGGAIEVRPVLVNEACNAANAPAGASAVMAAG